MEVEANACLLHDASAIINELFNFDGKIEELCAMSETEGQFGMSASDMIEILRDFVRYADAL